MKQETLTLLHLTWLLFTLWSILMLANSTADKMERCRRRYHSVSNHSNKPQHTTCLWGVRGGRRAPSKHQVSHSVPMNGQWLSINLPCQLVSRHEPNPSVHLKAIWSIQLTHSSAWAHLQSGQVWWREERWIPRRECEILNLRKPMTTSPKYR